VRADWAWETTVVGAKGDAPGGGAEGDGGSSDGRRPPLGRQSGAEAMVLTAGERERWRGCGGQRILFSQCGGQGRKRERPVVGSDGSGKKRKRRDNNPVRF
jgi:hypothetical protein